MKARAQRIIHQIEQKFSMESKLTTEKATEIIKNEFDTAFQNLDQDAKKKLYHALSIALHSDHLEGSLKQTLEAIGDVDLAQKLLNSYGAEPKTPSLGDFTSSPIQTTIDALKLLKERLTSLYNTHTRYIQPISALITLAVVVLSFVGSLTILLTACLVGCIALPQWLAGKIMSLFLDNKVERFIYQQARQDVAKAILNRDDISDLPDEAINNAIAEYEEQCLQVVRNSAFAAAKMAAPEGGDEDQIMEVINLEISAKNVDAVQAQLEKVRNFSRIKCVAQAIWETISESLPDNTLEAFLSSVLIRPGAFIFGLGYLVAESVFELLRFVHGLSVLAEFAAFATTIVATLFISNIPLYLYDGLRTFPDCCDSKVEEDVVYVPIPEKLTNSSRIYQPITYSTPYERTDKKPSEQQQVEEEYSDSRSYSS